MFYENRDAATNSLHLITVLLRFSKGKGVTNLHVKLQEISSISSLLSLQCIRCKNLYRSKQT